jgi:hypothetical protein
MTRWIPEKLATLAAVAVLAVPAYGSAQTTPPQTTSPQTAAAQPAPAQPATPGEDAARVHLTAARNSLSALTQLPAATQLTGDARTQVSQLITNFNELITTKAEWRAVYAKVEANLTALLGAQTTDESVARASGVAGAVGTSGTVSALDPGIRAKLIEFRDHLDKFEAAAGGQAAAAAPAATPAPAASGNPSAASASTPPSAAPTAAAPTSTAPPAAAPPAAAPPTATAATTPATPASPAAAPARNDQPVQVDPEEAVRHIEAIEVILNAQAAAQAAIAGRVGTSATPSGSTRTSVAPADVTLNREQIEQLRTHLAELRRLINK